MQSEKRELVPVPTLERDAPFVDRKEPAAAQSERVAPLEDRDVAGLMEDLGDADHLGSREFPAKHLANGHPALDRLLGDLVVDSPAIARLANGKMGDHRGVEAVADAERGRDVSGTEKRRARMGVEIGEGQQALGAQVRGHLEADRDELEAIAELLPQAIRAGISKREIERLTGVSRPWIDRLLRSR